MGRSGAESGRGRVGLRRKGAAYQGALEAVFIRAPIIRRVGKGVRVLARYRGDPVLVEQGRLIVATYHPELSADRGVQRLFLAKVGEEGMRQ